MSIQRSANNLYTYYPSQTALTAQEAELAQQQAMLLSMGSLNTDPSATAFSSPNGVFTNANVNGTGGSLSDYTTQSDFAAQNILAQIQQEKEVRSLQQLQALQSLNGVQVPQPPTPVDPMAAQRQAEAQRQARMRGQLSKVKKQNKKLIRQQDKELKKVNKNGNKLVGKMKGSKNAKAKKKLQKDLKMINKNAETLKKMKPKGSIENQINGYGKINKALKGNIKGLKKTGKSLHKAVKKVEAQEAKAKKRKVWGWLAAAAAIVAGIFTFGATWAAVPAALGTVGQGIVAGVAAGAVSGAIAGAGKGYVATGKLSGTLKGAGKGALQGAAVGAVTGGVLGGLGLVGSTATNAANGVNTATTTVNGATQAGSTLAQTGQGFVHGISQGFKDMGQWVANGFRNIGNAVTAPGQFLTTQAHNIANGFTGLFNGTNIGGFVNGFKSGLGQGVLMGSIDRAANADSFGAAFKEAYNGRQLLTDGLTGGLTSGISSLFNGASAAQQVANNNGTTRYAGYQDLRVNPNATPEQMRAAAIQAPNYQPFATTQNGVIPRAIPVAEPVAGTVSPATKFNNTATAAPKTYPTNWNNLEIKMGLASPSPLAPQFHVSNPINDWMKSIYTPTQTFNLPGDYVHSSSMYRPSQITLPSSYIPTTDIVPLDQLLAR